VVVVVVVVLNEIGGFAEDALRTTHEVSQSCVARLRLVPPLNVDKAISVYGGSLLEQPRVRRHVLVLVRTVAGLVPFTQAQEALALLALGLRALSRRTPFSKAVGALHILLVALSAWSSLALSRSRLKRLPPRHEGIARLPL
jgi:hypothetical protein